jgi:hypothetical protein
MFWNFLLAIASYALQLILAPKPQDAKPAALTDFDAPVAEEGLEIPDVFGTEVLRAPNVVWYGDLGLDPIKGARRYGFSDPGKSSATNTSSACRWCSARGRLTNSSKFASATR